MTTFNELNGEPPPMRKWNVEIRVVEYASIEVEADTEEEAEEIVNNMGSSEYEDDIYESSMEIEYIEPVREYDNDNPRQRKLPIVSE